MLGKVLNCVVNYAGTVLTAYGTVQTVSAINQSKEIDGFWKGVAETSVFIFGSSMFWSFFNALGGDKS